MFLAPQTAEEYEKRLNFYIMYFEACHSRGSEVVSKRADLAKEFGYEVKRTEVSELKSIRKPESLFWWPGAKVVAASKRNIHPFVVEEIKPTQVAKPTQPAKPPEPTKPVLFTKPVVAETPKADEPRPVVEAAKPEEVKPVAAPAKQDEPKHVVEAAGSEEPKAVEAGKPEEPKPVLEAAKPEKPKIERRSRVQNTRRRPPERQFQNRYADRPYQEERRRDAFESPLGDDDRYYRPPPRRYGETIVERRRYRREADAERPYYNAAPIEPMRRGPPPFWSFDSW
jgi:outer membrane biosynthesis protein TonB